MSIKKILVTGANGQLGWELSQLASSYPNYELVMVDRSMLDLSKPDTINTVLDTNDDSSNIRPIDCREIFSKTSPSFLPHAYRGEFYENLHKRF